MENTPISICVTIYDDADVDYYISRGMFLYPFHCVKGYGNYSTTWKDYNFDDNYGGYY